jgi:hypothetical protein
VVSCYRQISSFWVNQPLPVASVTMRLRDLAALAGAVIG